MVNASKWNVAFWHNQLLAYPHMLTSVLTRGRRNRIRFFETSSKNPISCLSLINQMLAGMQIVQVRKTPDLSLSGGEQKTHQNVLLYQIRTTGALGKCGETFKSE